jgi:hypothetical protein
MSARLLMLAVLLTALLAAPAHAAVTASVSVSGSRLVVTVKGTKARAVTLVAAGKTYKLTKSGSKWRSRKLATVPVVAGTTVRVRVRPQRGKTRTISVQVPAPKAPPAPTPPAAPPGTPVLFPPPAAASTGDAAWNAIRAWAANSTFTDCPAGWPNCAVETRYSHHADGAQYFCRLTPTSGADISAFGEIIRISGAEHKADGSWGFEYYLSSYGNTTFYSWSITPQGVVTGNYWGPGRDPSSGQPNESLGPLQYVSGAKTCSY